MFSWLTAAFQSLAALLGIAKNISDAKNSPEQKAAAKSQQEIDEEARETKEVADTVANKPNALDQLRKDAAE